MQDYFARKARRAEDRRRWKATTWVAKEYFERERHQRDCEEAGRSSADQKLAWIYARASHASNSNTDSVPAQIERCTMRFKFSWEPKGYVLAKIQPDLVTSAAKVNFFDRASGSTIGRLAQSGDVILVDKMDRIFRSLTDFCNTQKDLDERGILLEIGDCAFCSDPANPFYRAMISMMAMFAEMESRQKSIRVKDVFRRRLDAGADIHYNVPYGTMLIRRRRAGWGEKPLLFREWDTYARAIQNSICQKADLEGWSLERVTKWLNEEVFPDGKMKFNHPCLTYPLNEKKVLKLYWWEKMFRLYGITDAKQTRLQNWDMSQFGKLPRSWTKLQQVGWIPLPE